MLANTQIPNNIVSNTDRHHDGSRTDLAAVAAPAATAPPSVQSSGAIGQTIQPLQSQQSNNIDEQRLNGNHRVLCQPEQHQQTQQAAADREETCDSNPDFAVICSFIKTFGAKIDLQLNIEQLKDSIENQELLDDSLIDIHVKLFKKLRRYFVRDQWERALIRFANEYSYEHAIEIERQGYLKTKPSIRLELLRRLLDAQFECDQRFKAAVNLDEANDLRAQALGRDIKGNTYWYCIDDDSNFRVYSEEPLNYKSWRTVCKSAKELHDLLAHLESIKDEEIKGVRQTEPYNPYPDIFPEYFIKPGVVELDQDAANKQSAKKCKKTIKQAQKSHNLLTPLKEVNEISTSIKEESNVLTEKPSHDIKTILPKPDKDYPVENINNSIDYHVRQTIENLISRVVTSFDFFFRRNSDVKKQPDLIKVEVDCEPKKQESSASKPKKRGKREKAIPEEQLPRRSSSRIQQLQQKKITEFMETLKKHPESQLEPPTRLRPLKDENVISNINGNEKSKKRVKKDKQRWRTKGKKKLSWDKDDSDLSSVSSVTESNDESFLEEIEDMNPEAPNDDDEFACEEEDNTDEPVIVKRARTARQSAVLEGGESMMDSTTVEEDKPCGRCDKSDDAEWILLCDMCDDGYHTTCCIPPLMFVPDGDWFCPPCEHKLLSEKLRNIATTIDAILAEKERERQKRQRLRPKTVRSEVPFKCKTDEILPEKRVRSDIPDLNEPLAVQALDQLLDDESSDKLPNNYREKSRKRSKKAPGRKRNKRQRRRDSDSDDEILDREARREKSRRKILEAEALDYGIDIPTTDDDQESVKSSSVDWGSDDSTTDEWQSGKSSSEESEEEADEEEEEESQPHTRKARARVSYSFQEYDELIKSAIGADSDTHESSVDEKESEDDDDENGDGRSYGRGKDMATIEALAYQQENGLIESASGPALVIATENPNDEQVPAQMEPKKDSTKSRKRGRKLNDLDADSEIDIATSDESFQASAESEMEEDDDDDITEVDEETDSSIDELVARFKIRREKKKKKQKYFSESDDDE